MSIKPNILIVTIVNRGYSDEVMDAAREAGAQGGTILYSRGAGVHETETFFGIPIQPEKELVLILAKEEPALPLCRPSSGGPASTARAAASPSRCPLSARSPASATSTTGKIVESP